MNLSNTEKELDIYEQKLEKVCTEIQDKKNEIELYEEDDTSYEEEDLDELETRKQQILSAIDNIEKRIYR